ncbi:hypothetical protein Ddye_012372 [Dipteronia dyeriana]|uniref:RNase H type-1 domain-containing protein n=1 Tax=Dipteronia dyeriana TaxID=168575 RepID=A0AAD9X482_9ROSI|nr:hypothetical protein Ddye_012372 [Dipteronia dyeriana]
MLHPFEPVVQDDTWTIKTTRRLSSCVWRGTFWGREVLLKGIRCSIGDGSNIVVYNDSWIPRPSSLKIYSPRCMPGNVMVYELIEKQGKWNQNLVKSSFIKDEADIILSIPLSDNARRDSFLWHFDKKRVLWLSSMGSKEAMAYFLITVWLLWFKRNCLLYEGTLIEPDNCWVRVGEMLTMLEKSGMHEAFFKVDKVVTKFWDEKGTLVLVVALSWFGRVSVEVTEAKAILEGLLFEKDLGLFPLCVESDALGIVGLYNRTCTSLSDVNNVIVDILALNLKCTYISFIHIPRFYNKVAHAIARYSVVNSCSFV